MIRHQARTAKEDSAAAQGRPRQFATFASFLATALLLTACGSVPKRGIEREASVTPPKAAGAAASRPGGGGYYQDDGPGDNPPPNLDRIPDAEPKPEPLRRAANNPYSVFGQQYVPFTALKAYRQTGIASWYGRKFHGQRTSSGEIYDMYAMTAAHATLPIPSYARVTNLSNSRSVIVRVNDRGPFHSGRLIDLSYAAAYKLGYAAIGSTRVEVEAILPEDMPLIAARQREAKLASAAAPNGEPVAMAQTGDAARAPAPDKPVAPEAEAESKADPALILAGAGVPDTPPPKPAPAIPVDADASGVYLQLGAFSGRDNAENFRTRVYRQLSWLNEAIRIVARDGVYRLHLGPFRDRGEAGLVADKIRDALQFNPLMVVR